MNSFAKQGLAALSTCAIVFGAMYVFIFFPTKMDKQHERELVAPPKQYPYVDQIKMELILPAGENFVSTIPTPGGGGYFQLTTQVDRRGELGAKTFKVYTGCMGDRGVMINQPSLWYTVKEQ